MEMVEIGSRAKESEKEMISEEAGNLAYELADILLDSDEEIDHADAQVICYVSGALARSEWNQRHCMECLDILVDKEDAGKELSDFNFGRDSN